MKEETDTEKMAEDRRKADEEYDQQMVYEIRRIQRDGISNVDELLLYIANVIESVKHSEDLARVGNNPIVYSEAVGIRREFEKLGVLVLKDGTANMDGTEEKHREENDGEESYT